MATSGPPGKRIAKNPSLGELLFLIKLAYFFLAHLQLWPKIDKKTTKSTTSVKSPLGQDWGACLRSGCGLVRAWSGPFRSGLELTDQMDGLNFKKSILDKPPFPYISPFKSHHFGKLRARIGKSREFRKFVLGLSSRGPAWSAHPWRARAWNGHLRAPWEADR